MKRNYYIFTPGRLLRKDNTIVFRPFSEFDSVDDENWQDDLLLSIDADQPDTESRSKKVLPVSDIDAFYIMTEASFNTKFFQFLSKMQIPVHIFNHYGYYSGSYYPREYLISGYLTVKQVQHYSAMKKRMTIARLFLEGASFNLLKNLKYYNKRGRDLQDRIDTIESILPEIKNTGDIPSLMNVEGRIRKVYYSTFNEIILSEMQLKRRKFNPPENPINALVSFCNAMVYSAVLTEIYRTQLIPTISYLHEPSERRFSLALDIAEIFKPILADRIIFKAINTNIISESNFEEKLGGHYLKENGRKKIVELFDNRLKTTIKHRKIGREVSYKRLIRLECYKLIKHLTGDQDYEPFKIWW